MIIKKFLGIISLTIGIIGLILPILPGWLLIFAGLTILRKNHVDEREIFSD